jgi:hypothetical protein
MKVFLDFEASSLGRDSYPIEVGWVFEDHGAEAHLIRPAPGWVDWDPQAEAVHGIGRSRLEAEGEDHAAVARRMLQVLDGHDLLASAPSWDGKWLSVLLRAAGLPRHALRLRDTEEAQFEAALASLGPGASREQALDTLQLARLQMAEEPVAHRALEDARREWRLWRRFADPAALDIGDAQA